MTPPDMRYDIRLKIDYRYGTLSDRARTVVRLLPSDIPGRQIVTARLLRVDPAPQARRDSLDFFGNTMTALAFHAPVDRVVYSVQARATRLSPPPTLDLAPPLAALGADLATVRNLGPRAPHHFLAPSPRVAPDPAITGFARDFSAPGRSVAQVVRDIGTALHAEMRFVQGATDVHTPPAEAFSQRHGVCQDFSHIMIAALRAVGIPAGYVSGFLRTRPPKGQPRLEGADAMHAWVMAWCGSESGWTEFDPTNACAVERDHISVAYGRDYGDVAPVRGVLRTSGQQTSRHSVDVLPV